MLKTKRSKISIIICSVLFITNLITVQAKAADLDYNASAEAALEQKKIEEFKANPRQPEADVKEERSIQARSTSGTYPTRNGVILITVDKKDSGFPSGTGHAGIVYSGFGTVESFPSGGVQRRLNDWNSRYSVVTAVTTKGTTAAQDANASVWANSQVGKSYNYLFTNTSTRNSFYCSQLVWAAYKDLYGVNIDDDGGIVYPIDLAISKNTTTIYSQN